MLYLLFRLHQVAQRSPSSSSLSLIAACSSSSSSLWTAATSQSQPQSLPNAAKQTLQHCFSGLPSQQAQQQGHFSTYPAAADAAVVPVALPPELPCMLGSKTRSRQRLGNANVVQYPYPLPPAYTDRRWQLQSIRGKPLGAVNLPGDIFNVPVRIDIMHQVVRWQRAKARQGTHKTKDRSEVSGGGRKPWRQKGLGRARQGSIRAPQWRGGGVAHGPRPRSYAFALNRKVRRLGLKSALSAKANEGRLILVDSLVPDRPKTKVMAAHLQGLLDRQAHSAAAAITQGSAGVANQGLSSLNSKRSSALKNMAKQKWMMLREDVQEALLQTANKGLGSVVPLLTAAQGSKAARLSALLIDADKQGKDGGEVMRRTCKNLPGVEAVPAIGANVLSILRHDYVIMTTAAVDAVVERLRRPVNRLGVAGLAFRQKVLERRAAAARERKMEKIWGIAAAQSAQQQQQQQAMP